MSQTPISDLLRSISANIDLDLATTFADVLNVYISAVKRNSNRSVLQPDDATRILSIMAHILAGCGGEADPDLIPGAPTKRATSERTLSDLIEEQNE